MTSKMRAMGLSVLACGLCAGASAADTVATPADTDLQEVIVTGRLEEDLPIDLQKYGTRVDTVTATQIRNGGFIDVAQALQALTAGLYISPKSGPFDYVDVSLQGSRTQDVLWLVHGVRINNRLYGGTTPLDTLPSSIVDQIQILEGGEALFYGTEAAAGAINIVTKAFSDTPDGAVSVGGDTNKSAHFDTYYRDTVGRSHFVVYLDVDTSSGFQPFRTQDYQPSGTDRDRAYHVYTGGAKYAFDF